MGPQMIWTSEDEKGRKRQTWGEERLWGRGSRVGKGAEVAGNNLSQILNFHQWVLSACSQQSVWLLGWPSLEWAPLLLLTAPPDRPSACGSCPRS